MSRNRFSFGEDFHYSCEYLVHGHHNGCRVVTREHVFFMRRPRWTKYRDKHGVEILCEVELPIYCLL